LFSKYENVISDDDSDSLLELKGCVCYSIIKVSEDKNGIILRVFNPQNTSEKFTVDTKFEYKNVYESDLSEENLTKLESCSNSIFTEVLPHKIKTLYFEV
jgi:alpha-mannosidase